MTETEKKLETAEPICPFCGATLLITAEEDETGGYDIHQCVCGATHQCEEAIGGELWNAFEAIHEFLGEVDEKKVEFKVVRNVDWLEVDPNATEPDPFGDEPIPVHIVVGRRKIDPATAN